MRQNLLAFAGVLVAVFTVMADRLSPPAWVVWGALGLVVFVAALGLLWPVKLPWPGSLRRLGVAAVALVVAASTVFSVWLIRPYADVWLFGCDHPVEVRVLTSPDTLRAFQEVTATYERHTAASGHGCRAVNMYVFSMPASKVEVAFAQGWSSIPEPHPDVWVAGSRLELESVRGATVAELGGGEPVAWSPLVLGVPADAGYAGERIAPSWPELVDRVADAGIGVVRPNPTASAEGEAALLALYRATGSALIDRARAGELERNHAKALDAGGYPVEGDTIALLRTRIGNDRVPTAVVASEQALLRFNQESAGPEKRLSASCPANGGTKGCLRAFYPKATPRLEYPLVEVGWRGAVANDVAREPVRAFREWLGDEAGRRALNVAGLRPVEGDVESPLSEDNGVLTAPALGAPPPAATAELRDGALSLYREARRSGRVLIAVDGSGSMQEPSVGGARRIDVALAAVKKALTHLGPKDEYGLSTFSGQGVRSLLPVEAHPDAGVVDSVLGTVVPDGGTPLYRMVAEGVRELGGGDPNALPAVIVLTDGEDTTSGLTAEQTMSAVRDGGVRVYVVTIGGVDCEQGPLGALTRATGGSCYDSDAVTVGDDLAALFRQMWGM